MIDLRNLGGGKKLIKEVMGKSKPANQPWTKQNQYKSVKKQKNVYSPGTRPKNIF